MSAAAKAAKRIPFRHVTAVFVGNGREFCDFLTFSCFSVYIAHKG